MGKYNLIRDALQEDFTDLDVIRERPVVYKAGRFVIACEPVSFGDHPRLIGDMTKLVYKHFEIFADLQFLSHAETTDPSAMQRILDHVGMYKGNRAYKAFNKGMVKFLVEWGAFFTLRKEKLKPLKSNRARRKALAQFCADEIILMVMGIFVRNYDIVKKNTLEFLQVFNLRPESDSNGMMDTSMQPSGSKVVQMPKYSPDPYPRHVLNLFAEQSRKG